MALSIHEAEEILAEADLSGISLVDEQMPFLRQTGARLREQAHALLQTHPDPGPGPDPCFRPGA